MHMKTAKDNELRTILDEKEDSSFASCESDDSLNLLDRTASGDKKRERKKVDRRGSKDIEIGLDPDAMFKV